MVLSFSVPGQPVPTARARVVRGHAFTPKRTREYQRLVRCVAISAVDDNKWEPRDAKYVVSIWFYRGDARRADWDNLSKSCTDAMNGVVYPDDSQIVEAHVYKRFDKKNPRAEIMIERLG
jgi:Holliday junction resolvase RusA-like endonuclease